MVLSGAEHEGFPLSGNPLHALDREVQLYNRPELRRSTYRPPIGHPVAGPTDAQYKIHDRLKRVPQPLIGAGRLEEPSQRRIRAFAQHPQHSSPSKSL